MKRTIGFWTDETGDDLREMMCDAWNCDPHGGDPAVSTGDTPVTEGTPSNRGWQPTRAPERPGCASVA